MYRLFSGREVERVKDIGSHIGKRVSLLLPVEIVGIGGHYWRNSARRFRGTDRDKLISAGIRQRFQQHAIYNAKDRGVTPNPQSKNDQHYRRETGILAHDSETITEILQKSIHCPPLVRLRLAGNGAVRSFSRSRTFTLSPVHGEFLNWAKIRCFSSFGYHARMRDVVILFLHLIVTVVRLPRPGGLRSVIAESLLVKHQLRILNRGRKRAPNLCGAERIIAGLCTLLMNQARVLRSAIVLRPSTLFHLHHVLAKRKYRMLFSRKRRRPPGLKGPSKELIEAVVELKRRKLNWGCPRIAQQITLAFGVAIDKDVVRRILSVHFTGRNRIERPILARVPRPHERQPLEYGSVQVRVGIVAYLLGTGRHGSILASDHRVLATRSSACSCRSPGS